MTERTLSPILLVDDNPAHRRLVRRALSKAGLPHPVLEVSSLSEAATLLQSSEASLISAAIVDLNLGDGRGTQFVAQVRRHERLKTIPVIILSTSTLVSDMRDSYDHGADCYLIKSEDAMNTGVARGIRFLLRWPG